MKIKYVLFQFLVLLVVSSNAQWYGGRISKTRFLPTANELLNRLNNNINGITNPECFKPGKNVNDSVKNKLLSLLKHEWTDAEIKIRVDNYFNENFEYEYFYSILGSTIKMSDQLYRNRSSSIRNKSRKDTSNTISKQYRFIYDSVYKSIYDSLAFSYKKKSENGIKESMVPDQIVLSVATANIKEAIPILENDLKATKHYYKKEVAELALARLGDVAMQKKIMKECEYDSTPNADNIEKQFTNKIPNLIFISTQESIFQLHTFLDSTKWCTYLSNGTDALCCRWVISSLAGTLINKDLQDKFKNVDFEGFEDKALLRYVKQWLIDNKGKYQIDHYCLE